MPPRGQYTREEIVHFIRWKFPGGFHPAEGWERQWFRWTHEDSDTEGTISLSSLDAFLTAHGLTLSEFDVWSYDDEAAA